MQKRNRIVNYVKGVALLPLAAVLCYGTMVYAMSGHSLNGEMKAEAGLVRELAGNDNGISLDGNPVSDNDGVIVSGNGKDTPVAVDATGKEGSADDVGVSTDSECASVQETAAKPRSELQIMIDPGHGGEDEGCFSGGVMEKDVNLEIAKAVRDQLCEMGYQVVMTRNGDQFCGKEERVREANRMGADLYVSIHQNACEDAEPNGIEVWYCDKESTGESERLSRLADKYVRQLTGAPGREISETDSLYVLRETKMPACLIETGFLTNAQERAKLADPEYQALLAEGIADGIDFYFYPKTMYLTFDDGPSEENTNAVLDVLKEKNIKATFFVVGENVEKHPETVRRIAAEGHTIGIHCYHHDYEEIYADADSYIEDFWRAYQAVYEATGVRAKLFRFPGGSINSYNGAVYEEIVERMTAAGFVYFDWNASLEDAVSPSPEPQTLIDNAVSSTLKRKRVVMLGHDIVYSTTQCLGDLIDALPEYRMEPLDAETEPIQF